MFLLVPGHLLCVHVFITILLRVKRSASLAYVSGVSLSLETFWYWAIFLKAAHTLTQSTASNHRMDRPTGKLDHAEYKIPIPDSNCRQCANRNTMWWIAEISTHVDASEDTSCGWKKHAKHSEEGLAWSVVSVGVVGQNNCAVPNKTICCKKTINTTKYDRTDNKYRITTATTV